MCRAGSQIGASTSATEDTFTRALVSARTAVQLVGISIDAASATTIWIVSCTALSALSAVLVDTSVDNVVAVNVDARPITRVVLAAGWCRTRTADGTALATVVDIEDCIDTHSDRRTWITTGLVAV